MATVLKLQNGKLFKMQNGYGALLTKDTILYAGGSFTSPAMYVAVWNGSSWNALSGYPAGIANSMKKDLSGNLFVGAQTYLGSGAGVWTWNGSTWQVVGQSFTDGGGGVQAIDRVSDGTLYAGGNFTSPVTRIAKWNGSNWSDLGSTTYELVRAVAPCASRVQVAAELLNGCSVSGVKGRFVILGKHLEGQYMATVEVGKKGDLGSVLSLLDDHSVS